MPKDNNEHQQKISYDATRGLLVDGDQTPVKNTFTRVQLLMSGKEVSIPISIENGKIKSFNTEIDGKKIPKEDLYFGIRKIHKANPGVIDDNTLVDAQKASDFMFKIAEERGEIARERWHKAVGKFKHATKSPDVKKGPSTKSPDVEKGPSAYIDSVGIKFNNEYGKHYLEEIATGYHTVYGKKYRMLQLSEKERKKYKLSYDSENKILIDHNGKPASTIGEISKGMHDTQAFVMMKNGDIVIGTHEGTYNSNGPTFTHASLSGGKRIEMAGMISIENGKIMKIDDNSGHYQPKGIDIYRGLKKIATEMPGAIHIDGEIVVRDIVFWKGKISDYITAAESIQANGRSWAENIREKAIEGRKEYDKKLYPEAYKQAESSGHAPNQEGLLEKAKKEVRQKYQERPTVAEQEREKYLPKSSTTPKASAKDEDTTPLINPSTTLESEKSNPSLVLQENTAQDSTNQQVKQNEEVSKEKHTLPQVMSNSVQMKAKNPKKISSSMIYKIKKKISEGFFKKSTSKDKTATEHKRNSGDARKSGRLTPLQTFKNIFSSSRSK